MAVESRYRTICVEGPIAVGKTSLVNRLAERYNARVVLEEFDDNPFLREFYRDPESVAFQTQVYFLLARFKQQEKLLQQELFHPVTVCDYLFDKDRVFASMNLKDAELALYERIFSIVRPRTLKPDVVIYLHADVDVLMARLKKRARSYESDIEPDYLRSLMRGYDEHFRTFDTCPVLRLDTSEIDFVGEQQHYETLLGVLETGASEPCDIRLSPG